jgi:hypothetical protein
MVSEIELGVLPVQQAVFASSDRGNVKGYHLVAQSSGVDNDSALELTRWAPTQLPGDAPENWTISSWRLETGAIAVARTVYGGPEYSNRGGTQVVTLFLLLDQEQFLAYDCDAVSVATTAMALGYLKLPLDLHCKQLRTVKLPEHPVFQKSASQYRRHLNDDYGLLIAEAADLIGRSQPVAVVGLSDPTDAVAALVSRLTFQQRCGFSFTTGLSPSIRRPFQAQFYRRPDVERLRALDSQNVVCLTATSEHRKLACQ